MTIRLPTVKQSRSGMSPFREILNRVHPLLNNRNWKMNEWIRPAVLQCISNWYYITMSTLMTVINAQFYYGENEGVTSTNAYLESMTFCLRSDRFLGSHLGIWTDVAPFDTPPYPLLPLQLLSPLWFESVRLNRSPPQLSNGERCCKIQHSLNS